MAVRQINYLSRDFQTVRTDLINYLKIFFPDQWQDFNVASPGMALLELNAYVADLLSFVVDKKFNELFLDGVSETESVFRLAKTFGFKVPGVRPALTIADIIIEVPPTASGPDVTYLPVYRAGLQVRGAGQVFETINDIDFSSDFSEDGIANRIIEPILNGNQDLVRYRITKREKIRAGITKIFKKEVSDTDSKAFFELTLPENNVLEITSVIVFPNIGISFTPSYQQFNDMTLQYWEVEDLPENKIFLQDDLQPDVNGIKIGRYLTVEQRFIKEFMADGTCKLTFGSGTLNFDAYDAFLTQLTNVNTCLNSSNLDISHILNNTALGVMIPPNSTIFVKYRVGGGPLSNIGANTLTDVSNINAVILGADQTLNQRVISSTKVNNPIPAIGGTALPSPDEIKYFISANFASQDRSVTLEDYVSRAYQMPGKFGGPFRIFGEVDENKVKLYILSRDSNGQLISSSTSVIKNNLASFLVPFRMINDFIEINDGKVVNLQIEADLFIDKTFNSSEVKASAIQSIIDFFQLEKWQMNQNIYVSQINDILGAVPGIINVVDIRFFNMEGGGYSDTVHFQATGVRVQIPATGGFRTQIEYVDNAINGTALSMFELKFTNADVLVRVA